jgi:hypothetical protein
MDALAPFITSNIIFASHRFTACTSLHRSCTENRRDTVLQSGTEATVPKMV